MPRCFSSYRALLAAVLVAISCGAYGQQFPARAVRFIVPFPPGGGADAVARALCAALGEQWGQPVAVDNRPGEQANLGTAEGARAPADGYTLTLALQGALAINPHLYANIGYDPLKDFAPVARVAVTSYLAVAAPALPIHSLSDLETYAQQHPGALSYAAVSTGGEMVGVLFQLATGIKLRVSRYPGAAAAAKAVEEGRDSLLFSVPAAMAEQVKTGRLRPLAVMDTQRNPLLPEVPTALEQGYLELSNVVNWYGVVAPAATPKPIVGFISDSVLRALKTPQLGAQMRALGQTVAPAGPQEFGRLIAEEYERWARVVKIAEPRLEPQ